MLDRLVRTGIYLRPVFDYVFYSNNHLAPVSYEPLIVRDHPGTWDLERVMRFLASPLRPSPLFAQ